MEDRLPDLLVSETDLISTPKDKNLDSFLEAAEKLKQELFIETDNLEVLQQKFSRFLVETNPHKATELEKEISQTIDELHLFVSSTRIQIKFLQEENSKAEKNKHRQPSQFKMRTNLVKFLAQELLSFTAKLRNLEVEQSEKLGSKSLMFKNAIDSIPTATTQEKPSELIKVATLSEKRHDSAKVALQYTEQQHHLVVMLEQSVVELAQLFEDLGLLVEAQGALIADIASNVDDSRHNIERGTKKVKESIILNKKQKKKLGILLGLIAGATVVSTGVGLGLKFAPKL